MLIKYRYLLILMFCCSLAIHQAWAKPIIVFHSKIKSIPTAVQQTMQQYTWHPGCPVPLSDLAYLQLSYWGFDNNPHQGILIINRKLTSETVQIFHDLFLIKFPIAKMQPLDVYQGDDEKSMADNNTVAFNCRAMTGYSNLFSPHSYGNAIDINPVLNPYFNNGVILPQQSRFYLYRNQKVRGMIIKGDAAYNIFMKYGWHWGGNWTHLKDYQHFEKDH